MAVTVAADLLLTTNPPSEPPAFYSAMRQTGIEQRDAIATNGSLLIVMVEDLGVFAEPAYNERLFEGFRSEENRARYRVRQGVSPHAGATTGATSQALCGRWTTDGDYLAGSKVDCLPARLAARGYATYAVHAYTGRMFDGFDWYPKIGFERRLFEEQMRARGEIKGAAGQYSEAPATGPVQGSYRNCCPPPWINRGSSTS